ncbi:hypothetical protein GE061_012786 [Apolygus lucorum]|uniref:Uncharacterized protein n=1 Tax=Apolygus lucorum TaxID=248454 RepID=A0A8S9XXD0_APOLU|nr:hypothetical protein GE061_012786 [Apolygus lucorum]
METLVPDEPSKRARPSPTELLRCRALSTVMSASERCRDFDVIGKLCAVAVTEQLLKLFASPTTVNGTLLLIVLIFMLFSWKRSSSRAVVVCSTNGRLPKRIRKVHFESTDVADSVIKH